MVKMTKVESSTSIAAHHYDEATGVLSIHFKTGDKTHQYHGVPPDVAHAFQTAPSLGKYHAAHIRGKFHHEAVETA